MNIGYVRTSRKDQNPSNQITILVANGIEPDHIFVDAGTSGTVQAQEREGFKALMDFIDHNAVEKILLFEISRLGRTFLNTLILVKDLEERGIMVWSLSPTESWTRTEDRKIRDLMLSIFTWVADRERDNLVERTKLGQARARAEGKHIGRPFREIPWKKYDDLKEKGLDDAGISRVLNIPYATLRRRLSER